MLVQQDQSEAKQNVETRLDFIRGEMCAPFCSSLAFVGSQRHRKRVEGQLKDLGDKSDKKKMEVRPIVA